MSTEPLSPSVVVPSVAKNKSDKPSDAPPANAPKQYAVRLPQALVPRVVAVAETLGLDEAVLLRMIVVENLSAYEKRAERVRAGLPPTE
jgi:hypothetical protein